MIKYREILRLHGQGLSQRGIASACACSRNSVSDVLKRAAELEIAWPLDSDIPDAELQRILFPDKHQSDSRKQPDCEYIHKELAKSGVTLSLLWHEYVEDCRTRQEIPYSYRQYCRFYNRFAATTKATMRIKRKPGEVMEVDWAGQTATLKDNLTGEPIPAYVFVATLPCSQYSYVEAFLSMDTESWIAAHLNAFRFFGGTTRIIVPDNLKTGVEKPSASNPIINRTYQEMAEYYQAVIMPARVRKPKDKPSVEGTVGVISTWIIASLRNETFFSLHELNEAIRGKLEEFNEKDFQKKSGSRKSAFLEEEQFALIPLPTSGYEVAAWRTVTVQYDYHVNVDGMYYSVPYEYIKHQVDVRMTRSVIEVFFKNLRIASHVRLQGKNGQSSTHSEHMPDKHRQYAEYDRDYYLEWAETIGLHTVTIVKGLLASYKVEKQALKSCLALTKLADMYSAGRLESACKRALEYSPRPNINSLKTILKTGQEKLRISPAEEIKTESTHGFTRGAAYYGRTEK